MGSSAIVTYYHHSGFSVAAEDILLVFDYWRGENELLPPDRQITPEYLKGFREIYVFISHPHPDHFDPIVYTWREAANVTYIVSDDMPVGTRGRRMKSGDAITFSEQVSVTAFDSTDMGVSYLVTICGFTVFHAGDLNFWHWRNESTAREIELADMDFRNALAPLAGAAMDLAFFPVDPRQGEMFDAGADLFMLTVKPRILIPMHFWQRSEIIEIFARQKRTAQTEILCMSTFGESFRLEKDERSNLMVHLMPRSTENRSGAVNLENMGRQNPFLDCDLPVDMNGGTTGL